MADPGRVSPLRTQGEGFNTEDLLNSHHKRTKILLGDKIECDRPRPKKEDPKSFLSRLTHDKKLGGVALVLGGLVTFCALLAIVAGVALLVATHGAAVFLVASLLVMVVGILLFVAGAVLLTYALKKEPKDSRLLGPIIKRCTPNKKLTKLSQEATQSLPVKSDRSIPSSVTHRPCSPCLSNENSQ